MSKLVALQCGYPLQVLQVVGEIDMSDVEQAMNNKDSFEVPVFLPDDDDAIGLVTVYDLQREKDGWGKEYICGFVIENSRMLQVRLHDNPKIFDPLHSK